MTTDDKPLSEKKVKFNVSKEINVHNFEWFYPEEDVQASFKKILEKLSDWRNNDMSARDVKRAIEIIKAELGEEKK